MTTKLTKAKITAYKKAGYTHYINYKKHNTYLDCWLDSGFPTTEDALENTKEKLEKYSLIMDYEVIEL